MVSRAACPESSNDPVVYLVDDDRGMVSATSQWLSLSGLKVRAFADPIALFKVLKPGEPCVVVSDIRMPGIDGMELMKLIHGRDRNIPVVLITGHGDIPLAVEAMKSGALEFLQKPFSPERLLEVVKHAQRKWIENASTKEIVPPVRISELKVEDDEMGDLVGRVDAYERDLIVSALARHKGSMVDVIAELGIPRRTLNAKMKKYGIERGQYVRT